MAKKEDILVLKEWMERSRTLLRELSEKSAKEQEQIEDILQRYICCRYMLERIPQRNENIYDLAEESAAKMLNLPSQQLKAMEDISGCTGAKSAMVKKVLLIMSLKKELNWQMPEEQYLQIETIEDIIQLIIQHKKAAL